MLAVNCNFHVTLPLHPSTLPQPTNTRTSIGFLCLCISLFDFHFAQIRVKRTENINLVIEFLNVN